MESENTLDIYKKNGEIYYELSYPGGLHTGANKIINPSTDKTLKNLSTLIIKSEGEYPISSKVSFQTLNNFKTKIQKKFPELKINIEYN
jgi:hypothetical protein